MNLGHRPISDRAVIGVVLAGFALIILGLFAQSYNGREAVARAARAQCYVTQRTTTVPLLNVVRESQETNVALARNTHLPGSVRAAHAALARVQAASLTYLDQAVDPRAAGGLNAAGTRVIRRLQHQGRAYHCATAFPDAPVIELFHSGRLG